MHESEYERPTAAEIERQVRAALDEDVGDGDPSAAAVPADRVASAEVRVREKAVLCGREWFDCAFALLDPDIEIEWAGLDGDWLQADSVVCKLHGQARPMLSAERTALNFLQLLSATATESRRYAEAAAGTRARVLDTRKTLPGLRLAQKYAVRVGGCRNHRIGLYDAILLKENHIAAAGSIEAAVREARKSGRPVQVEVESLDELARVVDAGAERALLDNFTLQDMKTAVERCAGAIELEASGNVSLDGIRQIADTGVDFISVGALTKNVKAVDFSMRIALGTGNEERARD